MVALRLRLRRWISWIPSAVSSCSMDLLTDDSVDLELAQRDDTWKYVIDLPQGALC
jgi:hypothetical protein